MEVYLDLVMLLNFLVDFLLLLGTNRLAGFPPEPGRCALAAAVGGLYSGACLLRSFRFLGGLLWRTVFLGLMASLAFGWNPSAWKRSSVFLLLSMALGGLAVSFGRGNFWLLVLSAATVWLLCRVAFGQTVGGREYVPLTLRHGGRSASVVALRDSGNTLRDPITGEQVFLIAGEVASRLTGLTAQQLSDPLQTLAQQPIAGLRLIPYRAVGCSGGMLLGLRMEEVKLGERRVKAVVAFSPAGLGHGDIYQALVTA